MTNSMNNLHKMKPILISLILIELFTSCRTKLITEQPPENYSDYKTASQPSVIDMGVSIDLQQIEKGINSTFKGTIYEDNSAEDDNIMLKVIKSKDFTFSINGNTLDITAPLSLWVKYILKKNVLGIKVEEPYEATGALTVHIQSVFSIKPDWSISTQTSIKGYTWNEKPVIKAIGMNIPITYMADMSIKHFSSTISSSIDKAVLSGFDMKKNMEQVWQTLQNPIQIDKQYNSWIHLQPVSLYSTPIQGSGKKVSFDVGLQTIVETNIGTSFEAVPSKSKLPDYKVIQQLKPSFQINSNILVSYDKITEIAQSMVVGKKFSQGRRNVTVTDITVYGENDVIIVKIGLSGSVKGTVYCQGKLAFDNTLQQLQVQNFDFEIKTRNALVKSANWLMHKNFLKMIEPMLTIPLKDQIQSTLTQGNSILKNYKITKGIEINGNLQSINLQTIYITPKGIIISGSINGKIACEIGNLF